MIVVFEVGSAAWWVAGCLASALVGYAVGWRRRATRLSRDARRLAGGLLGDGDDLPSFEGRE